MPGPSDLVRLEAHPSERVLRVDVEEKNEIPLGQRGVFCAESYFASDHVLAIRWIGSVIKERPLVPMGYCDSHPASSSPTEQRSIGFVVHDVEQRRSANDDD